jgi:hypothetical protein
MKKEYFISKANINKHLLRFLQFILHNNNTIQEEIQLVSTFNPAATLPNSNIDLVYDDASKISSGCRSSMAFPNVDWPDQIIARGLVGRLVRYPSALDNNCLRSDCLEPFFSFYFAYTVKIRCCYYIAVDRSLG